MNLADDYMGPSPSSDRFLDLSVRLRGPAVEPLDEIFRADWQFAAHEALGPARTFVPATLGTTPVYVVPSGPDAPSDPLYDTLLTSIFRAERRFWVATPYFVPDQPLVKALSLAAHRGIDVRIVVPSVSNHRLADLVAAPILRELAADGVVVERLPRMLHAKAFLVDDRLAAIGSANFDMRSLFLDYEITLLFPAELDVARLSAWFESTVRGASTVLPATGWARSQIENVARLLAPLV